MRPPAHSKLIEKSRAACVAAVETYNRASAPYRAESFAILMINAWELLLKARIVQENNGKVAALYEYRPRKKKDGLPSKARERKLTRAGLPMTLGLERAYNLVSGYSERRIDTTCIQNIEALLEIRDSATHFTASDALLSKALTEIALAAVKNYVVALQSWFQVSFSDLNIASIPLSFSLDQTELEAVAKKSSLVVSRFLARVHETEAELASQPSPFAFSVKVEFDLVKKKSEGAVKASIVSDQPQITIGVDDDRVPSAFSWDFDTLTRAMKKTFTDFKQNDRYHALRRPLENDKKLCFERRLDPANKKSSLKRFYNPNIIAVFDGHYTRKGATLFDKQEDKS